MPNIFSHETNKIIAGKTETLNDLTKVLTDIDEKLNKAKEKLAEKTTVLSAGTQ